MPVPGCKDSSTVFVNEAHQVSRAEFIPLDILTISSCIQQDVKTPGWRTELEGYRDANELGTNWSSCLLLARLPAAEVQNS